MQGRPPSAEPTTPTLQGDIGAGQMLNSVPGVDPQRRERLIEALDIDVSWRMHQARHACCAAFCMLCCAERLMLCCTLHVFRFA